MYTDFCWKFLGCWEIPHKLLGTYFGGIWLFRAQTHRRRVIIKLGKDVLRKCKVIMSQFAVNIIVHSSSSLIRYFSIKNRNYVCIHQSCAAVQLCSTFNCLDSDQLLKLIFPGCWGYIFHAWAGRVVENTNLSCSQQGVCSCHMTSFQASKGMIGKYWKGGYMDCGGGQKWWQNGWSKRWVRW